MDNDSSSSRKSSTKQPRFARDLDWEKSEVARASVVSQVDQEKLSAFIQAAVFRDLEFHLHLRYSVTSRGWESVSSDNDSGDHAHAFFPKGSNLCLPGSDASSKIRLRSFEFAQNSTDPR